MTDKVLKIGITGGIGTGKTLVSKIFAVFGIPVYDADSRAKWISNEHPDVKKEITDFFGEEAYLDGKFNTRFIVRMIVNDHAKVEKLNSIVHPRVGQDFLEWVKQHNSYPYIIKEAALLFESESYLSLNKTIVVTAPLELRIQRVLLRDAQRTLEEIKGIIDKQMPEEEKLKKADFIVHNDEQQLLLPQIVALDKLFRSGNVNRLKEVSA
ncbi:MAG TPA: dephospho-CoA kinase [Cytophagaceae bacterium]|jgi:dephospho-CoA kinase|nr:dephospho-CoA kinase [Cytophagaceae bacterium]